MGMAWGRREGGTLLGPALTASLFLSSVYITPVPPGVTAFPSQAVWRVPPAPYCSSRLGLADTLPLPQPFSDEG